jgi:HK97 family phage major capsid protein
MRTTTLLGLRQRKFDLAKSAKNILDSINAQGRDMNAAEEANFNRMQKALVDVETQIITYEQQLSAEADMEMSPDENAAFAALANGDSPAAHPRQSLRSRGFIGVKNYAELFGRPRGNGGFKTMEEFMHAVAGSRELFDPRLARIQASGMTESNPTSAGFLVPELWAQEILNYALESSIVMQRARVFPLSQGAALNIPAVKDDDHSAGALYGGITEQWSNELTDINETDLQTRSLKLSVNKLALLSNASSELTEDAAGFEGILTANLQAAASFFLDKNFLFGSGAARPLGMLSSGNPSRLTVTHNAATPSHGFIWEDAVAMYTACTPAARGRSTWLFSNDLLPALSVMQVVVKNVAGSENVGGSATPMFKLNDDGTGTLLGRPVIFSEKMQAAGSVGDAALVTIDQYAILLRREFQLRRSDQAGFKNDSIWWRLTTRVDGQPLWANTKKLSNGLVTSPFVVLSAR